MFGQPKDRTIVELVNQARRLEGELAEARMAASRLVSENEALRKQDRQYQESVLVFSERLRKQDEHYKRLSDRNNELAVEVRRLDNELLSAKLRVAVAEDRSSRDQMMLEKRTEECVQLMRVVEDLTKKAKD